MVQFMLQKNYQIILWHNKFTKNPKKICEEKDIFNKAFLILEDWAANLSFDSLEIEKERGVVLEEWRLGQGAFERMMRTTFPAMFKDSRYANRLPIGKPEVLKTCKQMLNKQKSEICSCKLRFLFLFF